MSEWDSVVKMVRPLPFIYEKSFVGAEKIGNIFVYPPYSLVVSASIITCGNHETWKSLALHEAREHFFPDFPKTIAR